MIYFLSIELKCLDTHIYIMRTLRIKNSTNLLVSLHDYHDQFMWKFPFFPILSNSKYFERRLTIVPEKLSKFGTNFRRNYVLTFQQFMFRAQNALSVTVKSTQSESYCISFVKWAVLAHMTDPLTQVVDVARWE